MKNSFYIISCIILSSCASTLYVPVESTNYIALEDLKKGRELYVNNCASCHQLYLPNKYDAVTWMKNLNEMQDRAKITDEQKILIYHYLENSPK